MKEDKQIENVFFDVQKLGCYHNNIKVLDSVSFKIKKGEFVIIFGNNGSGKSTLAKHLNALILPDEGDVFVDGMNTKLEEFCFKIRQKVSFTFQNPDNQIVADRIEHDVAFGPENLGLSTEEIRYNVNKALKLVGLYEQKDSYIKTLSGGNKQKLVIAGAIAMGAECLVLDEPTSMLDETSKREILNKILVLNQEKNITIILLTHNLDEFNFAKRILILENGKLISDVSNMNSTDSNFFHKNMNMKCELKSENMLDSSKKNEILRFDNVSYKYENTQKLIFDNINIKFHENEVVGIMGRTGSGKTTLINLIKNFFCPTKGKILFRNKLMTQEFRFKTGIVFQYPENQLFEETVLKDVMFGPKNMGHPVEYALKIAKKSLEFMNFDESKFELSPFSLSGGEMRKVAIAGIIAMDPEILILDEPTAGLDYFARRDFLCSLANLHKKNHNTIIIISHCYEDLYFICNRILLIENSKIKKYKFN
ncbi:MAG: ATP-binding cassette domain-containing protein [Candidatus Improbicoccus devescovinae]|nr:MAG: ATP-binding cassette domain-containing protein [Candidatus Improbicoccus devescovinae]